MILEREKQRLKKMDCKKFEELFIKESPTELLIHIQNCESCKIEYEKMMKTEKLIKEAQPYFRKKKQNNVLIRAAACFALFTVSSAFIFQNSFNSNVTKIAYEDAAYETMPFDEYGLLDIE